MTRPRDTTRRARVTMLVALVAVTLAAWTSAASGQEAPDPGGATSTTASTTSTTAPPVTVVLPDGDFGVVPPGSGDPDAPAPETPPDGADIPLPPELPPVILPDPTPGLNAALADIDVHQAQRALVAAEADLRQSRDAIRRAHAVRAEAVGARRVAGEDLLDAKAVADALAQNAVMYGEITGIEPILGAPTLERLRDLELGEVVADKVYDDLHDAGLAYRRSVATELEATDTLTDTVADARVVRSAYLDVRTALDIAVRNAEEARRQVGPTILGPTILDEVDLVTWYRTYYAADPPVASIESIIDTYLRIGAEEGVASDIAFAQAILETGGFRSGHALDHNFAGIGAYDHCAPGCGFRFADLDDGVRAHLQLLRAYADPGLTSADLAAGPNALVAPENVDVRGCCPRWTSLTGVWASDPNYDRKVLGIYRLMVETARAIDRLTA